MRRDDPAANKEDGHSPRARKHTWLTNRVHQVGHCGLMSAAHHEVAILRVLLHQTIGRSDIPAPAPCDSEPYRGHIRALVATPTAPVRAKFSSTQLPERFSGQNQRKDLTPSSDGRREVPLLAYGKVINDRIRDLFPKIHGPRRSRRSAHRGCRRHRCRCRDPVRCHRRHRHRRGRGRRWVG